MKDFKTGNGFFTGNVGIGTTSPDGTLHAKGIGTHGIFKLEAGGTSGSDNLIHIKGAKAGGTSLGEIHFDEMGVDVGDIIFLTNNGTTLSEKMRVTSGGNVGIGTTNPQSELHIESNVANHDTTLKIENRHGDTGGTAIEFQGYRDVDNDHWVAKIVADHVNSTAHGSLAIGSKLGFYTWDGYPAGYLNPRMTIDQNGNVGIGTTNPIGKLAVVGDNADIFLQQSNGTISAQVVSDASGNGKVTVNNSVGNPICHLDSNGVSYINGGNVGIGTTSPANKLHIQQGVLASSSTNSNTSVTIEDASNTGIQFLSAGQTQLRFGDAGNNGAGSILYKHANDELILNTSSVIALQGGNVGIGTTNPVSASSRDSVLVVGGGSALESSGITLGMGEQYNNGPFEILTSSEGSSASLRINDGTTSRLTIKSNGNIGIGTTNPGVQRLSVLASSQEFVQEIRNTHTTSAYGLYVQFDTAHDNKTSEFIRCSTNGNANINFKVYSDGTILSDGSSLGSDDRIKHNEEKIVNAVETLSKITPKKYFKTTKLYEANHDFDLDSHGNPIDENGDPVNHRVEAGVIAQEVLGVDELKFAVSPETKDEDGNVTTPYALNYNSLFTYALAAIQEQQAMIEDLKSRIETLENK